MSALISPAVIPGTSTKRLMVYRPTFAMKFRTVEVAGGGWKELGTRIAGPRILRIETRSSLSTFASTARVQLEGPPKGLIRKGSPFTLTLDDGSLPDLRVPLPDPEHDGHIVMKGKVVGIGGGPRPIVECEATHAALERARANLSLSPRPIEDAISRLARTVRGTKFVAGSPGRTGIPKSKLVFQSGRTVAGEIRALACLAGFLAYTTPGDELFVGKWKPLKRLETPEAAAFRQVKHDISPDRLLAFAALPQEAPAPGFGLTFSDPRKPNDGLIDISRRSLDSQLSAGPARGHHLDVEGLSSPAAKRAVAKAHRFADVETSMLLTTLGSPEVRVGDAVSAFENGPALVTDVSHTLDGQRGFTTELRTIGLRPLAPAK